MKDMFDCLEESYNPFLEEQIFLIKVVKNKKRQKKILYLAYINEFDCPVWELNPNLIHSLSPGSIYYERVKKVVREKRISCQVMRIPKRFQVKPVRKEKWWDRIKVWFSRKVQYFAGYISIERPMKD